MSNFQGMNVVLFTAGSTITETNLRHVGLLSACYMKKMYKQQIRRITITS